MKCDMSIDIFYEVVSLKKYAILCGCAPDGFTQKKITEMHGFLVSDAGGAWTEEEIMIFPNGASEAMLNFVLERLRSAGTEYVLLYICTLSPVSDKETSVWLGGEEIRRSVIEPFCSECGVQLVLDCGREWMCGEEAYAEPGAGKKAFVCAEESR